MEYRILWIRIVQYSNPKSEFLRVFRFEINLDEINVKIAKSAKNCFNKSCSCNKFRSGTLYGPKKETLSKLMALLKNFHTMS